MLSAIQAIYELQRRHAQGWESRSPLEEDFSNWAAGSGLTEVELCNAIAGQLARGYMERRYSFEFCDSVVNELYDLMIRKQAQNPGQRWPKLLSRAFVAFDAGKPSNVLWVPYDKAKTVAGQKIAEIVDAL